MKLPPLPDSGEFIADKAGAVLDALECGIVVCEASYPWRTVFANAACERLVGHPLDGVIGKPLAELFRSALRSLPAVRLLEHLEHVDQAERAVPVSTPWRAKPFLARFSVPRPLPGGRWLALTVVEAGYEESLRENLSLIEEAFEYSPEAIMITDEAGTILRVNPAFTLITGYRPDEALGRNARILRSGRHDAEFYAALWRALVETGHWHGEIWDKRKNGELYPKWLCINAVDEPQGGRKYVALFADISERKQHEERIEHLAAHDALTGLANRRQLAEYAARLFRHARRGEDRAALLLIDLDHFKDINDGFGHEAGDRLLIEAAGRLRGAVRATDLVARLGGDEFVVFVTGLGGEDEAVQVAEKVRAALAEPYELDEVGVRATPSIGVALYPDNGHDLDGLLKAADLAMYEVKKTTRNGWRFYCREFDAAARRRRWIEEELKRALETDAGLYLVYQPQIDFVHGKVIAWEALLRWRHHAAGEIGPEEIVPVAESSGLIVPLGWWAIRRALADSRSWRARHENGERLALNISQYQLAEAGFAQRFLGLLEKEGFPPALVEIELLESALAAPLPTLCEQLSALRAAGVTLTIDDFGAGYATLVNLTRATVDRLKIDRRFTTQLHDGNVAAIVSTTLGLGGALGVEVVAEGVETAEQLAFLRERACVRAQGFHFGQPLAADQVAEFSCLT